MNNDANIVEQNNVEEKVEIVLNDTTNKDIAVVTPQVDNEALSQKQENINQYSLPSVGEMKEIVPDLCDSGVEHMKNAKLSKEQIKYLADYVENYKKGEKEEEERVKTDFVKNVSKEHIGLVEGYVKKVMGNEGVELLKKYSHDKDFYNFVKKQIESTQTTKLVNSDIPKSLGKTEILRQIKLIRDNPALYDDFSNQKEGLRESLTKLYQQLEISE